MGRRKVESVLKNCIWVNMQIINKEIEKLKSIIKEKNKEIERLKFAIEVIQDENSHLGG